MNEAESEQALRLVSGLRDAPMLSPLHYTEVASALSRRLPPQQRARAYALFEDDLRAGVFRAVAFTDQTFVLARDLVFQLAETASLRTLDAIHLAAALEHRADAFATLDTKLAAAAGAAGLALLPVS